jgi:predicted DNA-binding transcriptional regulator AlpA
VNSTLEPGAADSHVATGDEVAIPRDQKFLTTRECCVRFGITRETWRQWVKSRRAPSPAPLPGHPRWRVSDIERFERGRR